MIVELLEQKSMVFGHATFQRQLQFRDLVPQQSFGHLGQLRRENVPHRLPVHSSGLHGHMRHAALLEPIGQLKQIVSESREALLLFTALPPGLRPQHTGGNTLLMYVQTTTAGIDNFHRATPFHRAASDASKSENLLRVLSATSGGYNSLCFPASQPYS